MWTDPEWLEAALEGKKQLANEGKDLLLHGTKLPYQPPVVLLYGPFDGLMMPFFILGRLRGSSMRSGFVHLCPFTVVLRT